MPGTTSNKPSLDQQNGSATGPAKHFASFVMHGRFQRVCPINGVSGGFMIS
jgi:hypothetical protein